MKALDTGTKAAAGNLSDLEIKDAHLIFESVWQELQNEFGRENLQFPKEIIFLGGAPGAAVMKDGDGRHCKIIQGAAFPGFLISCKI